MNGQVPDPPTVTVPPDHKREFAGAHPGDLVAVGMQMKEACGAGRQGFL
jgi:hypothetical protein